MNRLEILKQKLEHDCSIVAWNPTTSQLQEIATQLAESKVTGDGDVTAIISSVCPNTTFFTMEGIDNSDLRALLALAIANTKG